jgi:magnesium chelatase family protein
MVNDASPERVEEARLRQEKRFSVSGVKNEKLLYNAQLSHRQVRKFCALGKEESELLKSAMAEFRLSARAFDKILKLARTIADLAESEEIKKEIFKEGYV